MGDGGDGGGDGGGSGGGVSDSGLDDCGCGASVDGSVGDGGDGGAVVMVMVMHDGGS